LQRSYWVLLRLGCLCHLHRVFRCGRKEDAERWRPKIINIPSGQIVDGYERVELQGQVKDATDAIFTDLNYANFSRDVSCEYVYFPQYSGTEFILVTVKVYYSGREIVSLRRLISR